MELVKTGKNSIRIDQSGVYLNGVEIPKCSSVTLKNISPIGPMEAVITIEFDEAKIAYRIK